MVLAPEFMDAFQEGSLAGATATSDGIDFSLGVLPEQEGAVKVGIEAGHLALDIAAEALHIAAEVRAGTALTIGTAGGVMLGLALPVINLLAALEVYAPEPQGVADLIGNALTARFGQFGANGAVDLFFIFAFPSVDSVTGAAFSNQAQAEQAARQLNNGDSFIARLNTGNPESIELATVAT
jgi:hypothetical protein